MNRKHGTYKPRCTVCRKTLPLTKGRCAMCPPALTPGALKTLPTERFIVPEGGATREQIARHLGCSTAYVGQVETRALQKLLRAAQALQLLREDY